MRSPRRSRRPARATPLDVHLKIDTGMHRVGCRPEDALDLARRRRRAPRAAAGGHAHALRRRRRARRTRTPREQLARFDAVLAEMRANGIDPGVVHACNTAGTLAVPAARRDLVRVGIGLYGIAPAAALEGARRAPARARGQGACLVRQGRRTRRRRCRTGCATRPRGATASRPSRSATPTACRARSGTAARSARARPPLRDRRHDHDGPADARRRRPAGRGR